MVFNKLKGDHKKCYGLLLVLFIIFGSFSDAYLDIANAESFPIDSYGVYHTDFVYQDLNCPTWNYTEGYHNSNNATFTACQIYGVLLQTEPVASTGNYWGATFKLNLVALKNSNNPWSNLSSLQVTNASIGDSVDHHTPLTIDNTSIQTYVTKWYHEPSFNYRNTLTIQVSVSGHGTGNLTGPMRFLIKTSPNKPFWNQGGSTGFYFEDSGTIPNINFSGNTDDTNSQTLINQNNTMINQNEAIINQNADYYNHEYTAESNISNQSANDIQGATNAQTTSIIGTISSFVSALGSVQAGSCSLTLPFPSFVGGQQVVNPCTGKDKAPTIVQIGSSMLLIVFFVPLAFIVLKMIYNEIRSWTNG